MSYSSNQDNWSYSNENCLFKEYDSLLDEESKELPRPNNGITGLLNEQQNKANNFGTDEQLDNNFKTPNENFTILEEVKQIKPSEVKFLTKKRKSLGRKPKNSTEIGDHTSASEDNQYDKNLRSFISHFINSLNRYIIFKYDGKVSPTLQNINVIKQFGSSNIRHKQFIKTKIYKVLIYNPPPNKKYKNHRDFGSHNEKIIREMVIDKKDELFTALMKLDIESIHNIFIQNKKSINIKDKEYDLSNFKILNDYIDEKIKNLRDNLKTEKEIENEIFLYKKNFTYLIKYVKEEKESKSRKKELDEKDIVIYGTIDELEKEQYFLIKKIKKI